MKFLYKTSFRRTLMRFLEIFIVAGLSGLVMSTEFEMAVGTAVGTGVAAATLKFLRELQGELNK